MQLEATKIPFVFFSNSHFVRSCWGESFNSISFQSKSSNLSPQPRRISRNFLQSIEGCAVLKTRICIATHFFCATCKIHLPLMVLRNAITKEKRSENWKGERETEWKKLFVDFAALDFDFRLILSLRSPIFTLSSSCKIKVLPKSKMFYSSDILHNFLMASLKNVFLVPFWTIL